MFVSFPPKTVKTLAKNPVKNLAQKSGQQSGHPQSKVGESKGRNAPYCKDLECVWRTCNFATCGVEGCSQSFKTKQEGDLIRSETSIDGQGIQKKAMRN